MRRRHDHDDAAVGRLAVSTLHDSFDRADAAGPAKIQIERPLRIAIEINPAVHDFRAAVSDRCEVDIVGKAADFDPEAAIRRLLEEGKKKILLNLAKVGYIDSSGIGELVSSYTAINKEGGELKLLNLTQKLQDLLTITKLLTVFDVYESGEEALTSFK